MKSDLPPSPQRHEENTKKLRETLCLCAFVANIIHLILRGRGLSHAEQI
ncbi:Uncharacterized protein dnm_067530 [Desulfonema magnum]|uniref:Uncharacterized protein n=1 Tax=Desulfonema magnum TaxID=45655 RepID=A0A975BSM0_9BACT|nr:Uncharacterized protein dnm_067530 [Desulfonema magnum]